MIHGIRIPGEELDDRDLALDKTLNSIPDDRASERVERNTL